VISRACDVGINIGVELSGGGGDHHVDADAHQPQTYRIGQNTGLCQRRSGTGDRHSTGAVSFTGPQTRTAQIGGAGHVGQSHRGIDFYRVHVNGAAGAISAQSRRGAPGLARIELSGHADAAGGDDRVGKIGLLPGRQLCDGRIGSDADCAGCQNGCVHGGVCISFAVDLHVHGECTDLAAYAGRLIHVPQNVGRCVGAVVRDSRVDVHGCKRDGDAAQRRSQCRVGETVPVVRDGNRPGDADIAAALQPGLKIAFGDGGAAVDAHGNHADGQIIHLNIGHRVCPVVHDDISAHAQVFSACNCFAGGIRRGNGNVGADADHADGS